MKKKTLFCAAIATVLSPLAMAEAFRINDIKIEGLQRVSPGAVYRYLGLKPGDVYDPDRDTAALQRLFNANLFSDVKLLKSGDNLIVQVTELPVIASISLEGNNAIKKDAIMKVFNDAGLGEGQIFSPTLLKQLVQSLVEQYRKLSKYSVSVVPEVKPLGTGRVGIVLKITEGNSAKIQHIDIVGNKIYSEHELLHLLKSSTPSLTSFFTRTDEYNPERIQADLQSLENFYLNRGFINFKILSSNIALAPDRKSLFWTITIHEGEPYRLVGYHISGDTVVPVDELRKLIQLNVPQVYDRSRVSAAVELIKNRLGDEGYALAKVEVVPDVDPLTKTVKMNFIVIPGTRMYVRHIQFVGNDKTYDRVLRRELRQQESSVFSASLVTRSQQRLRRLPQVADLEQQIVEVPDVPNQVDIIYKIKEQNTSYIQGGLGYGQGSGVMFNLQYGDNNFFGTGNQLSLAFGKSKVSETYDFNFTDPYFTADGISMNYGLSYSKYDFDKQNLSNWAADTKSATATMGYPLSEYNKLYLGGGYRGLDIKLGGSVAPKIRQYIQSNGHRFNEFLLNVSWARDTLNTALFPTQGSVNNVHAEMTLPGSTATYYKLDLSHQTYLPLGEGGFSLGLRGNIGLGGGYGKSDTLPFFRNYYVGGIGSLRGYQYGSVGPHYANGDIAGGALQVTAGAQLFLPRGFGNPDASYRLSAFVDAGSAYSSTHDFNTRDLRYSAGVALEWLSPIGLLSLSYAKPIKPQKDDALEAFQFNIGKTF